MIWAEYRKEKIAALEAACRRSGLPLTSPRRVIMEALVARGDHPSVDAIYESVQVQLPGVSRTTVYRVLELLVSLGVVVRVNSPFARAHFDADVRQHHHAICRVCERIVDLPAPEFDDIPESVGTPGLFTISGYTVCFHGVC